MAHGSAEDIAKHVRIYIAVFATLGVLTLVTVGAAFMHLPHWPAIIVALIIATIKAGLVACYFMHLISERSAIYSVLVLCAVFFVALMALPVLTTSETAGAADHAGIAAPPPAATTTAAGHVP